MFPHYAFLRQTCLLAADKAWVAFVHWLLFIHTTIFSSTRFESQVLIFRRIQLYTCSIWYCHSSWWPVGTQLTLCTYKPPRTLIESDSTICCTCTTVSSWRWTLETRNM